MKSLRREPNLTNKNAANNAKKAGQSSGNVKLQNQKAPDVKLFESNDLT